jgi:hypothetical protein
MTGVPRIRIPRSLARCNGRRDDELYGFLLWLTPPS